MGGRPMDQLIWGSVRKPAGSLMKELRFISAKSSGTGWSRIPGPRISKQNTMHDPTEHSA